MADEQSYFQPDSGEIEENPIFPVQFANVEQIPFVQVVEGLRFRPVFGGKLLISYVNFEPNTVAPMHRHPEEQMGLLLEGELEFTINGETRLLHPGDVYAIPPNVPHTARTYGTICRCVDIFSPQRTGYRELLDRAEAAAAAAQQTAAAD